ncbi:MAG: T9SS type A sorting domain-containing protein [Bacteroidia bacterium]
MKMKLTLFALAALFSTAALAQSNPVPQPLPYVQNFGTSDIFPYPAGIQGWRTDVLTYPTTVAAVNAASFSNRNTQADFDFAGLIAGTITSTQDLNAATTGTSNSRLLVSLGARGLALVAGVNTVGSQNIRVGYTISFTEFVGANDTALLCQLQYRVGTSGAFTDVPNGLFSTDSFAVRGDSMVLSNLVLPAAANNQPEVQVRWLIYSLSEIPVGSRLSVAIDNLNIQGDPLLIPATGLSIVSVGPISGAGIVQNRPFQVQVQAVSASNQPGVVTAATIVEASLNAGNGTLGGVVRDTIAAGSGAVTISGLTYNTAEAGVRLIVSRLSGDNLSASSPSDTFTVLPDPLGGFTIVYQEDFENTNGTTPSLPTGYKIYNIDGAAPDPAGSPGYGQDAWVVRQTDAAWNNNTSFENTNSSDPLSTWVMASTSYLAPQPAVTNRWVVLPAITLGPSGNVLRFQAMSRGSASFRDNYTIYASITPPTEPNLNVAAFEAIPGQGNHLTNPAPSREVETVNFPLPSQLNGLTVYFAFQNNTPDPGGDRLFIDNITLMYNANISVAEPGKRSALQLYPNPAKETAFVALNGLEGAVKLEVRDIQGRLVLAEQLSEVVDGQIHAVDVRSLKPGMYVMRVQAASGDAMARLIVQ